MTTLREEWNKEYHQEEGFCVSADMTRINTDRIADWFLSRTVPIAELKEKIKGMKKEKEDSKQGLGDTVLVDRNDIKEVLADGYNEALSDILSLLEPKI